MTMYTIGVDFILSTTVEIDASSPEMAEAMVMGVDDATITHLQGRSYASVSECTRVVTSVNEVG